MDKPPFSYEFINGIQGASPPSFLKIHNTGLAWFFKRYLMQETFSKFKFTLPEWWDADYFRYILFGWGYLTIIKTDKFGVIPQQCTLSGYNVFRRPTMASIANPLIQGRILKIGEECTLIKLAPDYCGIADLVDYYGDLMALTYETIATNILNSKLSYAFRAETQQEADTYKALYDKVASGEPAVVYRNTKKAAQNLNAAPGWETFTQNLAQNFIAPELLETLRLEKDMFLTEIGIPNLSVRKQERVNVDEANKNNAETFCKARMWLDELNTGIEQTIKLFPELAGKLKVDLLFEEVGEYAGDNERSGTVSV